MADSTILKIKNRYLPIYMKTTKTDKKRAI